MPLPVEALYSLPQLFSQQGRTGKIRQAAPTEELDVEAAYLGYEKMWVAPLSGRKPKTLILDKNSFHDDRENRKKQLLIIKYLLDTTPAFNIYLYVGEGLAPIKITNNFLLMLYYLLGIQESSHIEDYTSKKFEFHVEQAERPFEIEFCFESLWQPCSQKSLADMLKRGYLSSLTLDDVHLLRDPDFYQLESIYAAPIKSQTSNNININIQGPTIVFTEKMDLDEIEEYRDSVKLQLEALKRIARKGAWESSQEDVLLCNVFTEDVQFEHFIQRILYENFDDDVSKNIRELQEIHKDVVAIHRLIPHLIEQAKRLVIEKSQVTHIALKPWIKLEELSIDMHGGAQEFNEFKEALAIIDNCPNLRYLTLNYGANSSWSSAEHELCVEALRHQSRKMLKLDVLIIKGELAKEILQALVATCQTLNQLHITQCLPAESLYAMVEANPQLSVIQTTGIKSWLEHNKLKRLPPPPGKEDRKQHLLNVMRVDIYKTYLDARDLDCDYEDFLCYLNTVTNTLRGMYFKGKNFCQPPLVTLDNFPRLENLTQVNFGTQSANQLLTQTELMIALLLNSPRLTRFTCPYRMLVVLEEKINDYSDHEGYSNACDILAKYKELMRTFDRGTAVIEQSADDLVEPESTCSQIPSPPEPFDGRRHHSSLSQKMVINRLSLYMQAKISSLLLNDVAKSAEQRAGLSKTIKSIQGGICIKLAELYCQYPERFNVFLESLRDWDGETIEAISLHQELFSTLLDYLNKNFQHQPNYIGQQGGEYLLQATNEQPAAFVICNMVHAIAAQFENNQWYLYDPNCSKGVVELTALELPAAITKALGPALSITRIATNHAPVMENKLSLFTLEVPRVIDFVKQAGLLLLLPMHRKSSQDKTQIYHLLEEIKHHSLSSSDVASLFFYDASGIRPFWLYLISVNDSVFNETVSHLLAIYFKSFDSSTKIHQKLSQSLKYFRNTERFLQRVVKKIIRDIGVGQNVLGLSTVIDDFFDKVVEAACEARGESEREVSSLAQIQEKMANKNLIVTEKSSDKYLLLLALIKEYANTGFIANSVRYLLVRGLRIIKTDEGFDTTTAVGGDFYDFLQLVKASDKACHLIIDLSQLKPAEIASINSIFDKPPTIEGVSIPDNLTITAVTYRQSDNYYREVDLTSRLDSVIDVDTQLLFKEGLLRKDLARPMPDELMSGPQREETIIIDFNDDDDWQDKLNGHYALNEHGLTFIDGAISMYQKSPSKKLVFKNAPWTNEAFCYYVSLYRTQGKLPATIYRTSGYTNTKEILASLSIAKSRNICLSDDNVFILNPQTVKTFIKQLNVSASGKLTYAPFNWADFTPMRLYLTSSLSVGDTAKLLEAMQFSGVPLNQIHLTILPGATISPKLIASEALDELTDVSEMDSDNLLSTFYSKDIFTACLSLQDSEEFNDALFIEAEHLTASQLFKSFKRESSANGALYFSYPNSDLLTLLEDSADNRKIILKGPFSKEQIDGLLPYLIRFKDKLRLINDKPIEGLISKEIVKPLPAAKPPHVLPAINIGTLDLTAYGKVLAERFIKERYALLENALATNSILRIEGLTGVGKTSTLHAFFAQKNIAWFNGYEAIASWAESAGGVLFIDEANLAKQPLAMFTALKNAEHKRDFYYQQRLYQLSPAHRVVFAANPVEYGGARVDAAIFSRHATTLRFSCLPLNVIYHSILTPLLAFFDDKAPSNSTIDAILSAYKIILESSCGDIAVSVRELKSIFLLAQTYLHAHPSITSAADKDTIYHYFARKILVPLRKKQQLETLSQTLPPLLNELEPLATSAANAASDFQMHLSRQSTTVLLDAFILQHMQRKTLPDNDLRRQGGLGCINLEGEPGLGKTRLLQERITTHGLARVSLDAVNNKEQQPEGDYLEISPSLTEPQVSEALLYAFVHGLIVIINEINSCQIDEQLFNALSMGKSPSGENAPNAGFVVLASQNPAQEFKGRKKFSGAQERRMLIEKITMYSPQELTDFALQAGVHQKLATPLVNAFVRARASKSSPPNFRIFLDVIAQFGTNKRTKTAAWQPYHNSDSLALMFTPSIRPLIDTSTIRENIRAPHLSSLIKATAGKAPSGMPSADILDVSADGDCLFHAIALACHIAGIDIRARINTAMVSIGKAPKHLIIDEGLAGCLSGQSLRNDLVEWLQPADRASHKPQQFFLTHCCGGSQELAAELNRNLRTPGAHCGEPVAYALAHMLNVTLDIAVFDFNRQGVPSLSACLWQDRTRAPDGDERARLTICYNGINHYATVAPRNWLYDKSNSIEVSSYLDNDYFADDTPAKRKHVIEGDAHKSAVKKRC